MVERKTGIIKTLTQIDREEVSAFKFSVDVTDKLDTNFSHSINAVVVITDINDSPPQFSSDIYTTHLTEDDSMPGEARILSMVRF